MKSRKSFLLRISPQLHQELEAWAQQELRSVNGQIEYLLSQAVAQRKRARTADPEILEEGSSKQQSSGGQRSVSE